MNRIFESIVRNFKKKEKEPFIEPTSASERLKKRMENVLLTDTVSDEIKTMVESGSGCGFIALLRLLRHLDSPIFTNRIKRNEFIKKFKTKFNSLDADLGPSDLIRFCEENSLGVNLTAFYFANNLGSEKDILDEMSSFGEVPIDFPVTIFNPENFELILEENQVAILGLEKRTENGIEGHYLCSDENEIITRVNPGGMADLRKYLSQGFKISDVLVFEKDKIEQTDIE